MLTRIQPDPLADMSREMERMFQSIAPGVLSFRRAANRALDVPPMTVWSDEQAFHVELETPGYDLDDLEIAATHDTVTISGERSITRPEGASEHYTERTNHSFERSFTIGGEVDAERIEAELHNGVLHLTLPRAQSSKTRKVSIRPSLGNGPGESGCCKN